MILRGMLLTSAIGAALGSGLALADPPADEAVKKELAKLEGTWELVLPEGSKDAPIQLQFKGGKLTVTWVGQGSLPAELKVYPDTDPRSIDIEFKKIRREHYEGAYQIDGDTLRLVLAPSNLKARPTKIPEKPEPGQEHLSGVFKRQKP